ncbi:T7SS effector LXG polymorphic toxin [Terribacillus saccharophilus]|uniref:T7SS effector LXG polymorphic toxin n=1 Tax=Terribacillus saccharophilus TaxID=361277 RepID=UPI001594E808|nr:T7SS effector LXG polymorphic toxin [Terribacillus saccharophilus]
MKKIKNLDVRDIQQQVDSTKDFIRKTKESVEQVKQAINGVTTLQDGFAGNTADSIRSFYEEAHKPFLEFMESFLVQYEQALSTVSDQVLSFEPNESGFIRQEFLEGELTNKMQKAQDSLSATTDAINQQLNSVSDLAPVSHVKDSVFLESIADAKKKISKTVDNMYEMDSNATSKLNKSDDDMQQMKTYMSKLRNAIDKNNISVDNFNITQFNSEFFSYHNEFKLMAKGRNALATGESAEITEQEFEKLFPYTKNEEHVSDGHFEWHGTYYTLKDGRIVREYTHEDGISYEFVDKIPDPRSAPPSGFDKFAKGTWDFFTEDFFTVFDSSATKGERLLALGMITPWGKGAKVLKKGGEGISDFAKYIDDLGDSKSAVKNGSKEVKDGTDSKIKSASGAKQDDSFIGTLKGEKIHLKDVKVEEITYTKRLPEETAILRKKFNSSIRKNFLKEFSTDPIRVEYLKKAGLNENDIARMKNGLNPKGWQVHHNLPLDDGGTNDFSNLVLIKNDPYHKVVTNEQNSLTRDLLPAQSKKINWPMFKNEIYPPEHSK